MSHIHYLSLGESIELNEQTEKIADWIIENGKENEMYDYEIDITQEMLDLISENSVHIEDFNLSSEFEDDEDFNSEDGFYDKDMSYFSFGKDALGMKVWVTLVAIDEFFLEISSKEGFPIILLQFLSKKFGINFEEAMFHCGELNITGYTDIKEGNVSVYNIENMY